MRATEIVRIETLPIIADFERRTIPRGFYYEFDLRATGMLDGVFDGFLGDLVEGGADRRREAQGGIGHEADIAFEALAAAAHEAVHGGGQAGALDDVGVELVAPVTDADHDLFEHGLQLDGARGDARAAGF